MFEFELEMSLLALAYATPALEPLLQLPPTFSDFQPVLDRAFSRREGTELGRTCDFPIMMEVDINDESRVLEEFAEHSEESFCPISGLMIAISKRCCPP